jgi:hypothetical protein
LLHHPHLHCVVPGGGISPDSTRWVPFRHPKARSKRWWQARQSPCRLRRRPGSS